MSEQSERRRRAGDEERMGLVAAWFAEQRLWQTAAKDEPTWWPPVLLLRVGELLCHLHGVPVPSAAASPAPPTVPVRVMEGE